MPVSVFTVVTVAPGTTAPVGSFTVPETRPVTLDHAACTQKKHRSAAMTQRYLCCLVGIIIFSCFPGLRPGAWRALSRCPPRPHRTLIVRLRTEDSTLLPCQSPLAGWTGAKFTG